MGSPLSPVLVNIFMETDVAQVRQQCSCCLAPWRSMAEGFPSSPQWSEPLHPVHTRERVGGEDCIPRCTAGEEGSRSPYFSLP